MHRIDRKVLAVLSAVMLSGCHHMVPIVATSSTQPTPAAAFAEVKVGDKVRVTLQSGNSTMVVIAEVMPEAFMARDGQRFDYADVARVEVRRVSTAKTIALVAAMPFLMLILVGLTYHGK